jgi:hypothetical protein
MPVARLDPAPSAPAWGRAVLEGRADERQRAMFVEASRLRRKP